MKAIARIPISTNGASNPGVVVVVVDLVTSAAAPRARNAVSIIVAISMTANIFLMS